MRRTWFLTANRESAIEGAPAGAVLKNRVVFARTVGFVSHSALGCGTPIKL